MTFPLERTETGWAIRLPLRREEVRVEKRTVVAERVHIRRQAVQDVEHVTGDIRREQLRVESDDAEHPRGRRGGDLEVTQPLDTTTPLRHHGTLAETGLDDEPLRG